MQIKNSMYIYKIINIFCSLRTIVRNLWPFPHLFWMDYPMWFKRHLFILLQFMGERNHREQTSKKQHLQSKSSTDQTWSIYKWEKVYIGKFFTIFKIINVDKNCQLLNTRYMKFWNRQCTTLILSHWGKIKLITCWFAKTFTMN